MDMGTTTMSMSSMMTVTATTAAASASSTAMSMSMDEGSSSSCKISMLWNWNTIDACFLSEQWHITSSGMFAGSCIGVILLGVCLEFLRRAVKEYDHYLIRKHAAAAVAAPAPSSPQTSHPDDPAKGLNANTAVLSPEIGGFRGYRPSVLEQAVRALLHVLQFAVAYFLMLLAMYYNGYIIICIFIGSYVGAFVFQWEPLGTGGPSTSAANEATCCCG